MIKNAVLFVKGKIIEFIDKIINHFKSIEWKNIRIQKEDIKIGCGLGLIIATGILIKKFIKAVRRK